MSPRTPEQFEQIREDRKEKLIKAAFRVFAEETYHKASISKIAKEAGVSKGLLYNYFDSKEDLLKAIMQDLMDEVSKYFDFDDEAPLTEERIAEWVNKSMTIVKKGLTKWRFYVSLSFQPDVTPILMEMADTTITRFMGKFVRYFEEKGVKDPIAYMRYTSAIMDGIQFHIMLDPDNYPIEKSAELLIQQITNPIK